MVPPARTCLLPRFLRPVLTRLLTSHRTITASVKLLASSFAPRQPRPPKRSDGPRNHRFSPRLASSSPLPDANQPVGPAFRPEVYHGARMATEPGEGHVGNVGLFAIRRFPPFAASVVDLRRRVQQLQPAVSARQQAQIDQLLQSPLQFECPQTGVTFALLGADPDD